MFSSIRIQNFKSIVDLTVPLSNVNVFIGENGCGKSNILEAIGFASVAQVSKRFYPENLWIKGLRVSKPAMMVNMSTVHEPREEICIEFFDDLNGADFSLEITFQNQISPDLGGRFGYKVAYKGNGLSLDSENKIESFQIYTPQTKALRGLDNESLVEPLGINGENLDVLVANLPSTDQIILKENLKVIDWYEDYLIDEKDELKLKGFKLGRGQSRLYFKDRFMELENNLFSAENANEGILHTLFYLALFISQQTPAFFAIDNIETGLNPKLCRNLMKQIADLAIKNNKQTLITTHNPAVLDGLNLHDDRQRLYVVKRNDEGHTQINRIKTKPQTNGETLKLSEMWMRGYLGGLPTNF
jgi:predicted ATPase